MQVLVINSGSSSLKYQVRDIEANEVLLEGLIEKIGEPEVPDHAAALELVSAALGDTRIDAVGHRVVHGGERFSSPVLIDNEIIRHLSATQLHDGLPQTSIVHFVDETRCLRVDRELGFCVVQRETASLSLDHVLKLLGNRSAVDLIPL